MNLGNSPQLSPSESSKSIIDNVNALSTDPRWSTFFSGHDRMKDDLRALARDVHDNPLSEDEIAKKIAAIATTHLKTIGRYGSDAYKVSGARLKAFFITLSEPFDLEGEVGSLISKWEADYKNAPASIPPAAPISVTQPIAKFDEPDEDVSRIHNIKDLQNALDMRNGVAPAPKNGVASAPSPRPQKPAGVSFPNYQQSAPTAMDSRKKALAENKGAKSWFNRAMGVVAIAAVSTLGVLGVKAYQNSQKPVAGNVNKNPQPKPADSLANVAPTASVSASAAASSAPSATVVASAAPAPTISAAPSATVSAVASASAAPSVSASAAPSAIPSVAPTAVAKAPAVPAPAPKITAPTVKPAAPSTAPSPEILALVSDTDLKQIADGVKTIKDGGFGTNIFAPFKRAINKISDVSKRQEAEKNYKEFHRDFSRGVFASYMHKFAHLSPKQIQDIVKDKSHADHSLLTYLMREDKTAEGLGPDVSKWQSKVPAVDASGKPILKNGKQTYVDYEVQYEKEMKMSEEMVAELVGTSGAGWDKHSSGNIHLGLLKGETAKTKDASGTPLKIFKKLSDISNVDLSLVAATAAPVIPTSFSPNAVPVQKNKTGFNDVQNPNIPTNTLPGSKLGFNAPAQGLDSNDINHAIDTFNNSPVVKTADAAAQKDYRLAKEVEQHVADENQKLADFAAKRRSRGMFTKLADAVGYVWSGSSPEERAEGKQATGGIRGLFLSNNQRMAELYKNSEEATDVKKPSATPTKAPVETVAFVEPVSAPMIDVSVRQHAPVEASKKMTDVEKKALVDSAIGKIRKLQSKLDIEKAQRPVLPIEFKKDYKVMAADKSIKFVLERQIDASNLTAEAKSKAKEQVQAMIRTNGAFIQNFKLHSDGSRDLTLKDEAIAQLNAAAGVKISAPDEEIELTDADIVEVVA